ncbi:MAG: thioredoxin family protein [Gammaproteobacteria bacterium]|nr:thioredoxin family protein [Gammaproteobacteria bacterium]
MSKLHLQLNLVLFIAILVSSMQTKLYASEQAFFDKSFGDFSEELEIAKEEGKKGVFIFFEMDECPFCHRMKTTVLNQSEVLSFYKKHFKIFQVNIEGDVEMTDFQGNDTTQKDFSFKQQRVRATPVFAFFDLNGKRVVKYTGPTSSVEEFIWLGEYMVNEDYKKSSFTRYKRARRQSESAN